MNFAITLVHNKGDQENEAQIASILARVERKETLHDEFNEQGEVSGQFTTYHYEFPELQIPHEVRFFQVIPFGVTPPPNLYELDSHKVFYGVGDEDKIGDHTRFFNWGLKRSTDYGAEASIYLENAEKLDLEAVSVYLNSLADPQDKHELVEDEAIKVASVKFLKEVGALEEAKPLSEAVTEVKGQVREKGLKVG